MFKLLRAFPIRSALLKCLSAYDVAKLDLACDGILSPEERDQYLRPVNDLIWNLAEMYVLLREGMQILVLGNDIHALEQRLHNTEEYVAKYGHNRKLHIFLVGMFPILGKKPKTLARMTRFSVDGNVCASRTLKDNYQLRRLQASMGQPPDTGKTFTMSFNTSTGLSQKEDKGHWFHVKDVPDATIDLRIYVPCFEDRMWDEIRLPPMELLRMAGNLSLCIGTLHIQRAHLTAVGIEKVDRPLQRRLLIRCGVVLLGYL
ncbi:hypothetical protein T440DRAFT_484197 [Plenodomus tracheiphilus IPT5]|uniref:Uncharacterized protein n=1 Tax=Plenodomus tracheiphilus IPT5 TaxID=1408161 RepID=A0A6A7ANS8_9PLEO|nr:hypothetical protein T440DRAFT_484197 [Plenodomus tracheiphilus IPT5]